MHALLHGLVAVSHLLRILREELDLRLQSFVLCLQFLLSLLLLFLLFLLSVYRAMIQITIERSRYSM